MIALTTYSAAAVAAAGLLALGIARATRSMRAVRSTRTMARALVIRGEARLPIAKRTRLAQDVLTVLEYRFPAEKRPARKIVPKAARTAAPQARKGNSGPRVLAS